MNPNLFKSAEFYRRRYHNFATVLIIPLVLLVLFVFLYSFFGQKEVTIQSLGELTPTSVIASIQSTSDQAIKVNHLADNLEVKTGQVLIQYAEKLDKSQQTALSSQLSRYKQQKQALKTLRDSLTQGQDLFTQTDDFGYQATYESFERQRVDLEKSISKTNQEQRNQATVTQNTAAAIERQINQLYDQIDDYTELYNAIVSKQSRLSSGNPHQAMLNSYLEQADSTETSTNVANQYLTQIDTSISTLESSIANLNIQLSGTQTVSTYDDSLDTKIEALRSQFLQNAQKEETEIETQITTLEAQLAQSNIQLESQALTAPADGVIHLVSNLESPTYLAKGTEIAKIYPKIEADSQLNISYYVTSLDVTTIKKGQTVRLSLENIGNQPLTLTGQVVSIASSATQTEEGNVFKIEAQTKVSKTDSLRLKYGLQGKVTSVVAKKTFFNYYKDKLLNQLD